ncbi:conjugative transfer region protein TrbK [Bradyrhizobium brasilense]|uniref:Conjugative transfer region protein TrbK n=1 Tax=Bradyrhizobium brasilense TaxID=1419277 RepID=A0A1G6RP24_9BRAD|nr:putative entry exclusion protein TrbK-alt [Bradyrhizobium brasilense]SDD06153.1 conjugative transfer region protein TrbK [Bradyrhizobium brasilense]
MDGNTLARIGAIVFVAVAIVANAIEIYRKDDPPTVFATQGRASASQDPLAAELLRCSEIGAAGPHDPSCLKAWAENRRRFLGQPAHAASPALTAPTTLFPDPSVPADPVHKESAPADLTGPAIQADPARPEVR